MYALPINMSHTSLTSLRLFGNPSMAEIPDTSVTNEEIESYEADLLNRQQSEDVSSKCWQLFIKKNNSIDTIKNVIIS